MYFLNVWRDYDGNVDGWAAWNHFYCFSGKRDGHGCTVQDVVKAIEYVWVQYSDIQVPRIAHGIDPLGGFIGGNGSAVYVPQDAGECLELLKDLIGVTTKVMIAEQSVVDKASAQAGSLWHVIESIQDSSSESSELKAMEEFTEGLKLFTALFNDAKE